MADIGFGREGLDWDSVGNMGAQTRGNISVMEAEQAQEQLEPPHKFCDIPVQ